MESLAIYSTWGPEPREEHEALALGNEQLIGMAFVLHAKEDARWGLELELNQRDVNGQVEG